VLGVCLRAVTYLCDDTLEGDRSAVSHFRGEGLLLHEVEEDAGIGGEAGDGDTEVVIDADDFLLVGGEFFGVSLWMFRLVVWFRRESGRVRAANLQGY